MPQLPAVLIVLLHTFTVVAVLPTEISSAVLDEFSSRQFDTEICSPVSVLTSIAVVQPSMVARMMRAGANRSPVTSTPGMTADVAHIFVSFDSARILPTHLLSRK